MDHQTWVICIIVFLVKSVKSQENVDDIESKAEIAEYNFKQVRRYTSNNFYLTNVDSQFSYSRTKRFLLDCDCGQGMKNCIFAGRRMVCECENEKVVINGRCEDCACNNGICDAVTGVCRCLAGYGLQNDSCVDCNCGAKKRFCHFVEGIQFCNCDDQYISVNSQCEDCVCGKDEICLKRPTLGICVCPKGSGTWDNECDEKCDCPDGKTCFYSGVKLCICKPRKAKLNGTCVDCDCGENAECEFVDGVKTCTCKKGYELHDDTCKECDCGEGHSCTFKNGSSICLCAENFYEHEGACKECSCGLKERCEIIDGKHVCICKENFTRVDHVCRECWCGDGHACDFIERRKVCLCKEGFSEDNGTCEICDCGESHACEFQNGLKKCECNGGYSDNNGICETCFCGEDANCIFEDGEKVCICPDDQLERNGTCSDACLDDTCDRGICEIDSHEISCKCEKGYTGSRCDVETVLSQGAIYLISVLSAVTLFWVILLLVFIVRKRNRCRYHRNEEFDATMSMLSEQHIDSTT